VSKKILRWNAILERLSAGGALEVGVLASDCAVSAATIRRDLQQLEQQHLLSRTHGGALSTGVLYELPLRYKTPRRQEDKWRIAQAAVSGISEGMAVGLTGGTSTTEVARALANIPNLTVVTNALNIASELVIRPNIRLFVTGGLARLQSYELTGPLAESTLSAINLDVAFAGVDGISAESGFTTHHETEAHTNRALIARARRTVVVADSSKIGHTAFSRICSVEEVNELITDRRGDPVEVERLRAMGLVLTLV
jgi:DeoR family transcriptional regulator, aga operon transcriptional repressor